MAVDLLASMGLTVCAAIAISALAIGFGEHASARVRLAAVFAAWFLFVTMLAATEALHDQHGVGVIGLGLTVLLPLVILSVIVLRSVRLHEALLKVPFALLIGVNTIRVLGVVFLVLYAAGRLPGPFAPVAGWGDILVGLAAAPLAWFAHKRPLHGRPAVWAWNAFGLADLVTAVSLGATSAPGPLRLDLRRTRNGDYVDTSLAAHSWFSCSLISLYAPGDFLPSRQRADWATAASREL
jgi:hypothetical protein